MNMNNFSLSFKKEKMLPDTVKSVDGGIFAINADFKNILKIFRMFGDQEILGKDKPFLAIRWFFSGNIPPDAWDLFDKFTSQGEEKNGSGRQDFCFEFDAEEIYSAFWQVYGIDLLEIDMHWYKFKALLSGVLSGDNALTKKIECRNADMQESERKSLYDRAKTSVQIPTSQSFTQSKLQERISERLKNGQGISDLIGGG